MRGASGGTSPLPPTAAPHSMGLRSNHAGPSSRPSCSIKLRAACRTVVEVGVPTIPELPVAHRGEAQAIGRAVRDFWRLRLRMWSTAGGPPPWTRFLARLGRPKGRSRGARPAPAVDTHIDVRRCPIGPTNSCGQLVRLSPLVSASSESTNSRKTSSRGSTTPSPVHRGSRHRALLVLADALRRRRVRPGPGRRWWRRSGIPDRTARASASEVGHPPWRPSRPRASRTRRWKVSSASRCHHDPIHRGAKLVERRNEQVVGQGPLGREALDFMAMALASHGPIQYWEVAVDGRRLLQDHDVAAGVARWTPRRLHLHPDTVAIHRRTTTAIGRARSSTGRAVSDPGRESCL